MSALRSPFMSPITTATESAVPKNDRANDGARAEAENATTPSASATPTQARRTAQRRAPTMAGLPRNLLRLTRDPLTRWNEEHVNLHESTPIRGLVLDSRRAPRPRGGAFDLAGPPSDDLSAGARTRQPRTRRGDRAGDSTVLSVRFAPPGRAPLADTVLPLPSGDRHGDLLVIVGHRPTEIATVRIKDVARVVDADLAEPLVVLSLALVHCSRPFVLPFATRRITKRLSSLRQRRRAARSPNRSLGRTRVAVSAPGRSSVDLEGPRAKRLQASGLS